MARTLRILVAILLATMLQSALISVSAFPFAWEDGLQVFTRFTQKPAHHPYVDILANPGVKAIDNFTTPSITCTTFVEASLVPETVTAVNETLFIISKSAAIFTTKNGSTLNLPTSMSSSLDLSTSSQFVTGTFTRESTVLYTVVECWIPYTSPSAITPSLYSPSSTGNTADTASYNFNITGSVVGNWTSPPPILTSETGLSLSGSSITTTSFTPSPSTNSISISSTTINSTIRSTSTRTPSLPSQTITSTSSSSLNATSPVSSSESAGSGSFTFQSTSSQDSSGPSSPSGLSSSSSPSSTSLSVTSSSVSSLSTGMTNSMGTTSTAASSATSRSTTNTPTLPSVPSFTGFAVVNVTVSIDNATYFPPAPGQEPITLVLTDGTTVNLTHKSIDSDDASLLIPWYDDLKGTSSEGKVGPWNVSFGQRTFQSPGCSGVQCFEKTLTSFVSAAGNFQGLLTSVGSSMLQATLSDACSAAGLASEAGSLSVSLTSLVSDLGSVAESLGSAIESLDGAMSSVNAEVSTMEDIELQEFGSINGNYFEAYQYGGLQATSNIFRNMNNIIQRILKIGSGTPGVQPLLTAVQAQWKVLILGGGAVAIGAWSSQQYGACSVSGISDFLPCSSQSITQNNTDPSPRLHFIHFSQGFSIPLYNVITQQLDGGAGIKTAADASLNADFIKRGYAAPYGPGYTAEIRPADAVLLRALPFIRTVYQHPTAAEQLQLTTLLKVLRAMPEQRGTADSTKRSSSDSIELNSENDIFEKRTYVQGPDLAQRVAFSWQKGKPWTQQAYTRDDSQGAGITIFVLDTGVTLGPVNKVQLRNPATYFVSNDLALPNIPAQARAPEGIYDWLNHGTAMACLAGGHEFGIASQASMHLVKPANAEILGVDKHGQPLFGLVNQTPDAFHDALFHIIDTVKQNSLQGKAVVSHSRGWDIARFSRDVNFWYDQHPAALKNLYDMWQWEDAINNVFDDFFAAAKANGVIWVQAVSNDGFITRGDGTIAAVVAAGDGIPEQRGNRDSELIHVSGAITEDGTLDPTCGPRGVHIKGQLVQDDNDPRLQPGQSLGWIDLYAPSRKVRSCTNVDGTYALNDGSSSATATTAGLAAYFLGLPANAQRFAWSDERNKAIPWGLRLKQYMTALSYQWTDGPAGILRPEFVGILPFNAPSEVNMVYNGAFGPMNACPLPAVNRREFNDSQVDGDLCIAAANETEVTSWESAPPGTAASSWASSWTSSGVQSTLSSFAVSTVASPALGNASPLPAPVSSSSLSPALAPTTVTTLVIVPWTSSVTIPTITLATTTWVSLVTTVFPSSTPVVSSGSSSSLASTTYTLNPGSTETTSADSTSSSSTPSFKPCGHDPACIWSGATIPKAACLIVVDDPIFPLWFDVTIVTNDYISDNGAALLSQERGCGDLLSWTGDHISEQSPDGTWTATQRFSFTLPLTFNFGCVERAIASAGGPSGLGCAGTNSDFGFS